MFALARGALITDDRDVNCSSFDRFGILLASLVPALLIWANRASGDDWPQFLGPNRNGIYVGKDLAAQWPAEGPAIVWKRDVGQGFAGPVVSEGKLILFHRVADKDHVECLDAKTGQAIWSAEYPTEYQDDFGFDEGPRATPTIAGGHVYTFGAEGSLRCWDLATGKPIWAVDTKKELGSPKGYFGRACSPLVEGSTVIVNVGAEAAGVVAFDKDSGKLVWKATHDAAGYSSPTAATIHGKRYVLVLTREGLAAIDPATGNVYFDFHFRARMDASVNAATPLVIDETIFLSASYGAGAMLLHFDEKGPEKIWAGDGILSNHYATSVQADGFLYGFDGRQEQGANLRCVELKTGKVRWSEDHFGSGTIMIAGAKLLILSEKGELLLAPATPQEFKPMARAQVLGFDCRAYPALAQGLFYGRDKQNLVCVDLRRK